jgi:phosphoribosyl 1,2-cyclic phosphodiesterase
VRFTVLGSGSGGNSTLIEADGTRLLVDAGFSARDLARRLDGLGVDPDSLTAIVLTHDHGDHTRGMGVYARRHGTRLHMTARTREACSRLLRGGEQIECYEPGRPFVVGALTVEPFLTVHDAADAVGVAVVDSRRGLRLGIATDLGRPTSQIRHALSACHALVLEANHDEVLLQQAPYPWQVKARIRSSHGHLSNEAAARFALELLHPGLSAVVLAHLSRESNHPDLARRVVGRALRAAGWRGRLEVAAQDHPTGPLDMIELQRGAGSVQLPLF